MTTKTNLSDGYYIVEYTDKGCPCCFHDEVVFVKNNEVQFFGSRLWEKVEDMTNLRFVKKVLTLNEFH